MAINLDSCADQKIQEDMRALFQHLENLKLSCMSEAPPVASAYQPHSARSSQSDSTIQSCEESYKGNELKKAAAICHKLSSRKYQPVGLDQGTVNCLVESQINAGMPVSIRTNHQRTPGPVHLAHGGLYSFA